MGKVDHNCGFFVAHTLHDTYAGIKSLQHRGKDVAGVAAISEGRIDVVKWIGRVSELSLDLLHHYFPDPSYHAFFGHVRYATRGRRELRDLLLDAHPHVVGGKIEDKGNHVVIRDCEVVGVHNGQVDPVFLTGVDESQLRANCDTERLLLFYHNKGERTLMEKVPGSYTVAIADKRKKQVIVMRDRHGLMPGVLGEKDNKFVVASETVAIDENGGKFHEFLRPGSIYYVNRDGGYERVSVEGVEPELRRCFFQGNYVSHEDSVGDGVHNRFLRRALGRELAGEFEDVKLDFATYVPDCPEQAALAFADVMDVPFINLYYKVNPDRSFQEPTQDKRALNIKKNLHAFDVVVNRANKKPVSLEGKVLGIVDDSIVRGTVIRRSVEPLKESGLKKVHFFSYTPMIGHGEDDGCEYGVDMPPGDNFVARGRTAAEISKMVSSDTGVDVHVHFLSPDRMLDVYERMGMPRDTLCTRCIGGLKPF